MLEKWYCCTLYIVYTQTVAAKPNSMAINCIFSVRHIIYTILCGHTTYHIYQFCTGAKQCIHSIDTRTTAPRVECAYRRHTQKNPAALYVLIARACFVVVVIYAMCRNNARRRRRL